MSELSLPAQAYLLACDVDKNRLRDRQPAGYLVRGAALTDLLLRGHLVDNDGVAVAVSGGTAGDEVLAELLGEIARSRPRRWKIWVRMDFRGTLRAVETQLEAARVIRVRTTKILGLFRVYRPTVLDVGGAARLRAVVDNALGGGLDVSQIDPTDAALTALAAAVELRGVVSGRDRRRYRRRIEELQERGGAAIPAVRKVFSELRAARNAAASSDGGG
jgi:hypothetical protein